jgi:sugar/nucleoside kinase (ribokinase family)
MNVLVIGKPKYNITLLMDSYPLEGTKTKVNEKIEITGGTSVYVACMLAKWGINVYYAGVVCGDEVGNKIKAELESFNVNTKFIDTDYEHKSGLNYVLLNKTNGSSTEILNENDVYLKKYKYDILPDYIITDGSDMGASVAAANNYPLAKMILFANKVSGEYYDLSKRCAYVCANMSFASSLTKMEFEFNRPKSLVALFQKIKDLNRAQYILMLRDKGVLYINNNQVKMIPAITVEKKDDANSGAAFFGAYCYGIINNYDMDTIAKTSNIAGALALTKIGSLLSIPDKNEVYKMAGVNDNNYQANISNQTTVESTETLNEEIPKTNLDTNIGSNADINTSVDIPSNPNINNNVNITSNPIMNSAASNNFNINNNPNVVNGFNPNDSVNPNVNTNPNVYPNNGNNFNINPNQNPVNSAVEGVSNETNR